MFKNFKRGLNGDYGVKVTPGKLRNFCEIDWPAFGAGWPLEGSLDKVIVNRDFEVDAWEPGHTWTYIDFWQDAVFSQLTWLKLHLDEACRVMEARVAQLPSAGKKCKKSVKPT
jgi:hypothetical protein